MEKQKRLGCIISLTICATLITALPALSNNFAMSSNPAMMVNDRVYNTNFAELKTDVVNNLNRIPDTKAVINPDALTGVNTFIKPITTDSNGFVCVVPSVTFVNPGNLTKVYNAKDFSNIEKPGSQLINNNDTKLINVFPEPDKNIGKQIVRGNGNILITNNNFSTNSSDNENQNNTSSVRQENNSLNYYFQNEKYEENNFEKFQNSKNIVQRKDDSKKRLIHKDGELVNYNVQAYNRKDEYNKNYR